VTDLYDQLKKVYVDDVYTPVEMTDEMREKLEFWYKQAVTAGRVSVFSTRFRFHPQAQGGPMKYTVVTRTVILRQQEVDFDFGPLVSQKQADALVRGGAKRRVLLDPTQLTDGKIIYEGHTTSSIVRGSQWIWGSKPTAAKIEQAEVKPVKGATPVAGSE